MNFWLVKQEPTKYSWLQFCQDKTTTWDGVRNYQARNNLKMMAVGDKVLFYHSNVGKEIVGIAEVTKAAYPDPTAPIEDWLTVELKPLCSLNHPLSLAQIKQTPELAHMGLLKQPRLSVMPILPAEFQAILSLSNTQLL